MTKTTKKAKKKVRKSRAKIHTEPSVAIVTFTPEECMMHLEAAEAVNANPRPLSQVRVAQYTRMLQEGDWEFNGQSVSFDKNGHLVNGQHRFWASVEANRPITTVVAYNVEGALFTDQGAKRTARDVLKDRFGAVTGMAVTISRAVISESRCGLYRAIAGGLREANPHIKEVCERIETDPQIVRSAELARKGFTGIAPSSVIGIAHYFATKTWGAKISDEFLEIMRTGDAPMGSPPRTLRERLMRTRESLPRTDVLALTIRAYNLFARGKDWKKAVLAGKNAQKWNAKSYPTFIPIAKARHGRNNYA